MSDLIVWVAEHLVDRLTGPLHARLIVNPFLAVTLAAIDGFNDARIRKRPYFWSLLTAVGHRRELLKDGWRRTGKVFVLALALDVAYQLVALRQIYVGEAILVTFALAILPYLVFRGLVTRLARLL